MKKAIKFSLFPKKVNGVLCETLPIRVRVSYGGNRVELRLGYSIEPAKWKAAEERVTVNTRNRFGQSAGEINREILKTEERINEIFTRFELLEHRAPTPEELKAAYEEATGKRKPEPQPEESGLSFYRPILNLWKQWVGRTLGAKLPIRSLIACANIFKSIARP